MKPVSVRKDYAVVKARRVIREMDLTGPPVLAREVAEYLGIIFDYHMGVINYPISFEVNGEYYISVNVSGNEGRDNWSGVHEIAHVDLGHFRIYEVDTLGKTVLTNRERQVLDREADIYARELLMPKDWILQAVDMPLTARQVGELKDLFMVSWKAIIIRLEELGIAKRDEIVQLFRKARV